MRKWRVRYRKYGMARVSWPYHGSQGSRLPTERAEVIAFLSTKEYDRIEDLCAYLDEHDGVVYQSKQSDDDLLHEAHISWKKTEHTPPDHDEARVLARRSELNALLTGRRAEIDAGERVVFLDDECPLLWGDTVGYLWGRRNQKIAVPLKHTKDRQT